MRDTPSQPPRRYAPGEEPGSGAPPPRSAAGEVGRGSPSHEDAPRGNPPEPTGSPPRPAPPGSRGPPSGPYPSPSNISPPAPRPSSQASRSSPPPASPPPRESRL